MKLRKIFNFLFKNKSPIDIEIDNLKKSLKTNQYALEQYYNDFINDNLLCCPFCAYGSKYTQLCDKIDRQEKRLTYLIGKTNGNK